jgi:hypothetical protein
MYYQDWHFLKLDGTVFINLDVYKIWHTHSKVGAFNLSSVLLLLDNSMIH